MFPSRQWPVRLPGWLHPLTNPAAMSTATAPIPETSTGPDVVIGVDTHKHTHMAVALSANGGWLGSLKLEAKRSGYRELMRWAAELGSNPLFARGRHWLLRRRSLPCSADGRAGRGGGEPS